MLSAAFDHIINMKFPVNYLPIRSHMRIVCYENHRTTNDLRRVCTTVAYPEIPWHTLEKDLLLL
jgi:hypothetical protein